MIREGEGVAAQVLKKLGAELSQVRQTVIKLISSAGENGNKENISILEKKSLDEQMIEVYNEAMTEFERGDVIYAGKKFSEAELLYPQSIWAPRAALMAAYSYFSQLYYNDTIVELEKFLQKYENHPRRDYAYYLLALCHYDQIIDETKDLNEILKAKKYFEIIIERYPNTSYASDSTFKLEYIFRTNGFKRNVFSKILCSKRKVDTRN